MTERPEAEALADLLRALAARKYQFVPPTPETHRRVAARERKREAADLRDVFGWSLPFRGGVLDPEIVGLMRRSGVLLRQGRRWKSSVRVASLGPDLFLHSAFPVGDDGVFFGPDTYRFVDFICGECARGSRPRRVLDFGAGSGVGGIALAHLSRPTHLILADVNPEALRLAAANAIVAGVPAELREANDIRAMDGPFDMIIANPPFIADGGRTYRDGGGMLGAELSLEWAREGARLLDEGGRMLIYTGAAICAGRDALREALEQIFADNEIELSYRVIDPDIFGEELSRPVYRNVDRIAAVGIGVRRTAAVSEQRQALEGAKAFFGAMVAGAPPR